MEYLSCKIIKFNFWVVIFFSTIYLNAQDCSVRLDGWNNNSNFPAGQLEEYSNCIDVLAQDLKTMAKFGAEIEKLKNERMAKKTKIETSQKLDKIVNLKNNISEIKNEIKKLQDEIKAKQIELDTTEEPDELKKEMVELKTKIDKLEKEVSSKEPQLTELENSKDLENLEKEVAEIEAKITNLEDLRNTKQANIETLRKSFDKLIQYFDSNDDLDNVDIYKEKKKILLKIKL